MGFVTSALSFSFFFSFLFRLTPSLNLPGETRGRTETSASKGALALEPFNGTRCVLASRSLDRGPLSHAECKF